MFAPNWASSAALLGEDGPCAMSRVLALTMAPEHANWVENVSN